MCCILFQCEEKGREIEKEGGREAEERGREENEGGLCSLSLLRFVWLMCLSVDCLGLWCMCFGFVRMILC